MALIGPVYFVTSLRREVVDSALPLAAGPFTVAARPLRGTGSGSSSSSRPSSTPSHLGLELRVETMEIEWAQPANKPTLKRYKNLI